MLDVRVNYEDKNASRILGEALGKYIDDNAIIINIGTDRAVLDSLAPLSGSLLSRMNFHIPIYGDLKRPIHAKNIEERLREIKATHPKAQVIAIDSCIGDGIGGILIKKGSIKPGSGAGKNLPEIGDISIKGVVTDDYGSDFLGGSHRLNFIMQMAEVIADALIIAENTYKNNRKELAVSNY